MSTLNENVTIAINLLVGLVEKGWGVHLIYAKGDPLTYQNIEQVWEAIDGFWQLNQGYPQPRHKVIEYQGVVGSGTPSEWPLMQAWRSFVDLVQKLPRHSLNDHIITVPIRTSIKTVAKDITRKLQIDNFTDVLNVIRGSTTEKDREMMQANSEFENITPDCDALILSKLLYELPQQSTEMGYAVVNEDTLCVAFRGTKTCSDVWLDVLLQWKSGYERTNDRVEEYVKAVNAQLESGEIKEVCFVGHSLGGLLAPLVASKVNFTDGKKKVLMYNPYFAINSSNADARVGFVDRCLP
jgi:hypothetical protein